MQSLDNKNFVRTNAHVTSLESVVSGITTRTKIDNDATLSWVPVHRCKIEYFMRFSKRINWQKNLSL